MGERVRVRVEADVDEVWDVRPAQPVARGQLERVGVVALVLLHPRLGEPVAGQRLPLAARCVCPHLEPRHHRLAEDRRHRALGPVGEEHDARRRVLLQADQPLDGEELREGRGHLGQREARVVRAVRLPLERQRPVHRVAELVRERDDVAELVGVVHEDEGEHGLRDRVAVRAADLARARLRVDVPAVEAGAEDLAEPRLEVAERVVDHRYRLRPLHATVAPDRGVLVRELEPVEAEHLRLADEPAAAERVVLLDGAHHRLDDLAVELVALVRRPHRIGDPAQPVDREPVADERVVTGRLHVRHVLQRPVEDVERREPQLAVGMVDVGEETVDRVRLGPVAAVELDGQRRELAAVQRLPGRDRGPARVERLLLALGQDVRLLLPRHPQPVPVRLELGGFEQRVRLGVVERQPLELDEEEEALEVGGPVAGERREVVRLGVRRIGVLARGRVEMDAGDVLRELVELVEQLPQPLGAGRADRAAPPLGEVACTGEQLVPVAARLLGVRLEIAQIPADPSGAER